MHKLKLVLSLSFQLLLISFSYGQTEITKDGFEKAINFANCKYVAFSLTNAEENQKFIKDSHSDKNPTAQSIKNAISKKKTKTIAFSKEFDKLKEINIDLVQKNIASFLTDSIFSKNLGSNYIRIYNYGKSRKGNQKFIAFKNDLYKSLLNIMDNHAVEVPIIAEIEEEEMAIASSENSTLLVNEISEVSQYNQGNSNWYKSFLSKINILSIIISVLLSFLLMSLFYYKFLRNTVSNEVKNYVAKKISRLGFDERFNRNQHEINRLKGEIIELKVFIHKLKYPDRMYDEDEFNNDLEVENKKTSVIN